MTDRSENKSALRMYRSRGWSDRRAVKALITDQGSILIILCSRRALPGVKLECTSQELSPEHLQGCPRPPNKHTATTKEQDPLDVSKQPGEAERRFLFPDASFSFSETSFHLPLAKGAGSPRRAKEVRLAAEIQKNFARIWLRSRPPRGPRGREAEREPLQPDSFFP